MLTLPACLQCGWQQVNRWCIWSSINTKTPTLQVQKHMQIIATIYTACANYTVGTHAAWMQINNVGRVSIGCQPQLAPAWSGTIQQCSPHIIHITIETIAGGNEQGHLDCAIQGQAVVPWWPVPSSTTLYLAAMFKLLPGSYAWLVLHSAWMRFSNSCFSAVYVRSRQKGVALKLQTCLLATLQEQ